MKRILCFIITAILLSALCSCQPSPNVQIAATTAPVYEFTTRICQNTDIHVGLIISENISCLHDYTLRTEQMQMIENAQIIVLSGAGLDTFLHDVTTSAKQIDASTSIDLLCDDSSHEHSQHRDEHSHEHDPHIWLSPANACKMAQNIYEGLKNVYPQHADQFASNFQTLLDEFSALETYGTQQLQALSNRHLITFHDGFAYFAQTFKLDILHSIEEESGSEASAAELIEICNLVNSYNLPAIFTEQSGAASAAEIISAETGSMVYQLDMAMSGNGYFNAMYSNIDTIKEALG